MKKLYRIAFLPLLLIGLLSACSEESHNPLDASNPGASTSLKKLSDNYLVVYSSEQQMLKSVEKVGGTLVDILHPIKVATVTGLSDDAALALADMAGVQEVLRDELVDWVPSFQDAVSGQPQAFSNPAASGDPWDAAFFGLQWGLQAIDAPGAWNVTKGASEIRVGVLDTGGSPDHQDLAGKYDLSASINLSWSNAIDPTDWQDRHFHGTHVAGTISTNNIGVAGVAPDVTLVAVKVLGDDGSGAFEDILAGIIYATDVADCDIINMSLGGYGARAKFGRFISLVIRAVNYANSQGALVVMSAGNAGLDLDHNGPMVVLPAEAGAGMVISATGPVGQQDFDSFSCYSNYGNSAISVAAPGGNVDCVAGAFVTPLDGVMSCLAPWIAANVIGLPNPTTYYTFAAGTSMAAPHVAGTAALVEAAKGNSNPGYLQARLQNTADDLGAPGNDPYFGKGRINAAAAVQ
ncbi:MAG: S8 family serine peptidase [Bacteroidota bacterium]|nr:S8 family serine peptidase [Bacteroidota bacterium]